MEKFSKQKINSYTLSFRGVTITVIRVIKTFAWYADYKGKRYGCYCEIDDGSTENHKAIEENYKAIEQNAEESINQVLEKYAK